MDAAISSEITNLNYLGRNFTTHGSPDEAIICLRRALQFDPANVEALCNLVSAIRSQGRVDEAIAVCRQALTVHPHCLPLYDNLLFSLQFSPDQTPDDILAEHEQWRQRFAADLENQVEPHANDRTPDRNLKIGYVSAQFCAHVLAAYMLPLFRAHDRNQFDITYYVNVAQPDSMTDQFRQLPGTWRDISQLGDDETARLIRADQIDILLDLVMHMDGNRLLVFARKPAPVQMTWLAYPGTTGLRSIDYRLTDPYLDPPGLTEHFYSEQTLRLPNSFWCLDPMSREPVSDLPALRTDQVTFGCLNSFVKVSEGSLRLWSQILRRVERSRLLLLAPHGSARQWVLNVLLSAGVPADRVTFIDRQARGKYLATYHHIDIALDTLPYNGHTTSIEALWMGVPVVTLVGETIVGRAGLSQLSNLGLADLIARDPTAFIETAASLAADRVRLRNLRSQLRKQIAGSPLFDTQRFVRSLESTYRSAWRKWCKETDNRR